MAPSSQTQKIGDNTRKAIVCEIKVNALVDGYTLTGDEVRALRFAGER